MAINEVTSIDVKTLPPFKRLIMTLGELPTSYLESMTYAELLMWFCNFLQEKVLPTINNNADALQEVITYLENLDLQDEVDHKLDEMAESGQLQEIIASYLNANALWCFDNVEGMKAAPNLIAGSFARTLGYYSVNDGGNGLYKIRQVTNEDTEDDMLIIALNDENLVAELVSDKTNLLTCGGKKDDNTFDNGAIINKMISAGLLNINIPTGNYYCSTTITLVDNLQLNGNNSTIHYTGTTNFIEHTTTDELAYVKIKSLKIYGTTSATGIRVRGFIESSIEDVLLQNFNIGLYTYYSWDSYFKKVRIQSCNKPFDLASQSNNLLFDNCAFATFNTRIECNNAESVTFNSCDFTGCTATVCIYGYQSNLNFIGCYYEELSGKFLAIPDNGACYINIYGGKCTDEHLILMPGKSYVNFTDLQLGKVQIVGRNSTTDNPAVSTPLSNLNMPEHYYLPRFKCVTYFNGTYDITYSATTGVTQEFTAGKKVFYTTQSGINYFAVSGLTAGNQYLIILEGAIINADKNVTFQFLTNSVPDTSGLYSTSASLENNRIICPFRAMSTAIRIGWNGPEAFHINKLIIMEMN